MRLRLKRLEAENVALKSANASLRSENASLKSSSVASTPLSSGKPTPTVPTTALMTHKPIPPPRQVFTIDDSDDESDSRAVSSSALRGHTQIATSSYITKKRLREEEENEPVYEDNEEEDVQPQYVAKKQRKDVIPALVPDASVERQKRNTGGVKTFLYTCNCGVKYPIGANGDYRPLRNHRLKCNNTFTRRPRNDDLHLKDYRQRPGSDIPDLVATYKLTLL